jgi:hypothetical protein
MWTRGGDCWFCIGTSVTRCTGGFDCLPGGRRIKDVEWTGDLGAIPLMQGFEVRGARGGKKGRRKETRANLLTRNSPIATFS